MDKSPSAFRTISEVAEDLDLPQHVLRFWETRFGNIKPLKRAGGRRYYRPDDVLLLRGIKHLLYGQGYTIRGVQRILKEEGARQVMSIWQGGEGALVEEDDEDTPAAAPSDPQPAKAPAEERYRSDARREPSFYDDVASSSDALDDDDDMDVEVPQAPAASLVPVPPAVPAERQGRTTAAVQQERSRSPSDAVKRTPEQNRDARQQEPLAASRRSISLSAEKRLQAILRELIECRRALDQR